MWVLVTLLIGVCAADAVAAQEPTFRADTQLVPIFATVTDPHGGLVLNLSAQDFEVLDEGRPQPLAFFTNVIQPVATVVVLDTSASTTLSFNRIREAAEQFVIRLLPDDMGRICAFNDKIQFSAAFTHDRDALARSVREIDFGNRTRLYDALAASLDELAGMNRRRVILVFTDGYDTQSKTRVRAVLERARAQDVMIYGIGLQSRERDGDEFIDSETDTGLQKLAADTGGGYFELERSRDLAPTFTQVARELHNQYLLAFSPASRDGRVHKLIVRLKNRPDAVRARRSYLAAAARQQR